MSRRHVPGGCAAGVEMALLIRGAWGNCKLQIADWALQISGMRAVARRLQFAIRNAQFSI
jgi:hypothetical protein